MIFEHGQVRVFLEHLKGLAPVLPLRDWHGENAIILRHDIDFDIGMAHRMAAIEREVDVRSTHYLLTTCPTYNVLEKESRDLPREMCDWGFEIGLRFDPTLHDEAEMKDAVDREIEVLRFVTRRDVRAISPHNPSIRGFVLVESFTLEGDTEPWELREGDLFASDPHAERMDTIVRRHLEKHPDLPIAETILRDAKRTDTDRSPVT